MALHRATPFAKKASTTGNTAGAWLGPARFRAVEVEPVAAATARLKESLLLNGLSGVVQVTTAALGDGIACVPEDSIGIQI